MAELLSDRYELVHQTAEGPVAALWRANLRGEGGFVRPVAVRVLREPWDRDPAMWSAWAAHATELARSASPHIEEWLDLVVLGGRAFVVTEWIDGVSLRRWIAATEGRTSWPLCASIAIEVLRGLDAAHKSAIWHGGVDARTVRISRAGTVKIVRFGAASALAPSLDRTALEELGIARPAPETAAGGALAPSCDLFAVGALLFTLLSGRAPFDAARSDTRDERLIAGEFADLSTLREDVPPLLIALIETALRSDPSARFTSADAMIRGLAQLLRSAPERSDAIALAESVARITERSSAPAKPAGLPEQSTMHVDLSEVTVLPSASFDDAEADRRKRYHFPHKERAAAQAVKGLKQAPQQLSEQESEALPLLLTRRTEAGGSVLATKPPEKLGIAAQKTELLDGDQLDRLTLEPDEE